MRSIYPKLDHGLHGLHALKKYIEKYKGVEIQFLEFNDDYTFDFEEDIRTVYDLFPNIKEITIHPPLYPYCLEMILLKDPQIVIGQLEKVKELASTLEIQINILYHVDFTFSATQKVLMPYIKNLVNVIKGYNVNILLENGYTNLETSCSVIEICKFIGDPQLKVCLDICHIHCLAHIYKTDIKTFMKKYLTKKDCIKYVHQVHFCYTAEEDGYINLKKTHGKKHPTRGSLLTDLELLYQYGLYESIFVTEINEDDYSSRKDEVWEIDTMEDIYKMIK